MAVLDEALEREYAMLTTRSKALAIEGEGDEYAKKKERREEPPSPTTISGANLGPHYACPTG